MNISELCIRRPVMTVLINAAVIVAGALAYSNFPIAALPTYDTPTIQVSANLPGASPETMASSVATPLERQFSTIAGVNTMSSTSSLGSTQITLEFDQGRNIDAASVDVQAALLRAQRSLPIEMTTLPSYRKVNPADAPVLFLTLISPSMPLSDLNSFAENLIVPSLSTLPGVAQVDINGQKKFAIRVRVDPEAAAARGMTLDDVSAAIRTANANTPVGTLEGPRQTMVITANRQLTRANEFSQLIIATTASGPVRLADVAKVEDSVESVKTASWANGERAITMSIRRQPDANTVAVVDAVKAMLPKLTEQLPSSVDIKLRNDRSQSIRDAIHDVQLTLLLTVFLVVMVIFIFLRHAVATLIPTLSLPISLLGTLAIVFWLGYSLDNISLLAITLAVGLVVDDAIVVLENIVRHMEDGMEPMQAALQGSREMSFTIVSISVSLVAVFIPIFFMPGVIGLLFHEFAVVVGVSVLVSAMVSLTLIPMLASRFLKPHQHDTKAGWAERSTAWFERMFNWIHSRYERTLDAALGHRKFILGVALGTFVVTGLLFYYLPKGFFPDEDIGQILATAEAVEDISFPAVSELLQKTGDVIRANPAVDTVIVNAFDGNSGRIFVSLKPRGQRPPIGKVVESLRRETRAIAGINVFFNPLQNLRLGGRPSKSRYQYSLKSVDNTALRSATDGLINLMRNDPLFRDVTSDAQLKGLQARFDIDRERANSMGVNIQDIRSAMYSAFGERQIASIFTSVDSYQVIMQVGNEDRADESAFNKVHVRAKGGKLIPLSALGTVRREIGATAINHAGQLEALTISFNLAPGAPLGDASKKIEQYRNQLKMPPSILTAWGGDAAAFQSSQGGQAVLIISALLVIYVLLGVLYESYIHPLTILAGLPSAAVGALATLWIFGMDLSIIATIGIVMLIGIVKKNAIMMIDFALDAQRTKGMSPHEAIRTACLLRFRPILMTTLAALMGALPIAFGIGAGAELRQPLGLAVVGGLLFSQVITLYITPVIYLYLDRWSGTGPLVMAGDSDQPMVPRQPAAAD
ncbi:MAG: efflux RND transporter permease subunit [Betaproteobacteria bacterium]|nr:efflux RND transporter permease subunit [Betaproteobacteria bacterium]